MATSRPSSAPLFVSDGSEGPGLEPTSNQFLGDRANHHASQSTLGPRGNKVQSGQLPRTSGPGIGTPDAVNPLGAGSSQSLTG